MIYKDLVPQGGKGFGSVVMTVLANPAFTMSTLAEMDKLIYMLQILVPLAFIPFRRPIWLVLAIPGFFFTVCRPTMGRWSVSTSSTARTGSRSSSRRGAGPGLDGKTDGKAGHGRIWLGGHQTARGLGDHDRHDPAAQLPIRRAFPADQFVGGPIKYTFGVDAEGRRRHQAAERLVHHLPPRAKVSGSGFTTRSSRTGRTPTT